MSPHIPPRHSPASAGAVLDQVQFCDGDRNSLVQRKYAPSLNLPLHVPTARERKSASSGDNRKTS